MLKMFHFSTFFPIPNNIRHVILCCFDKCGFVSHGFYRPFPNHSELKYFSSMWCPFLLLLWNTYLFVWFIFFLFILLIFFLLLCRICSHILSNTSISVTFAANILSLLIAYHVLLRMDLWIYRCFYVRCHQIYQFLSLWCGLFVSS